MARGLSRFVALVYGAAALAWPALWAGSPIWYPDAVTYLSLGRRGLPMLQGIVPRAEFYCMAILALHWNRSAWPVIAMNALLVSWVIWLVVRILCPHAPLRVFCGLIAVLCLLSTAPWYVSFLSPDILGAVLYLTVFLLVFVRAGLRRWETFALMLLACWIITTHPTHLLVTGLLCGLLAVLWLMRWPALKGHGRFVLQSIGLVLVAMLAQIVLHAHMWGKPSPLGPQPPFLLARLQSDGQATQFLRRNCGTLRWVICKSVDKLPVNENIFLWNADGIYQTSTPEDQKALTEEELPLLLGTMRAYPREQIRQSADNTWVELTQFGLEDKTYADPWTMERLDFVIPGAQAQFASALSRLDSLPRSLIRHTQEQTMLISALFLLPLTTWAIYQHERKLFALEVVVVIVLIANAAATGILSGPARRYEARIAWLLPMLVILMLYGLFDRPLPPDPRLE